MNLLIKVAVLAIPLALAGTATANATPAHHTKVKVTHVAHVKAKVTHVAHVHGRIHTAAVHRPPLYAQPNDSIAQLINYLLGQARSFGYTVPINGTNVAGQWQVSHDSGDSSDWTYPSDDNSAAAAAASDAETQAAIDAENNAIQQMNDTNAETASMAAAEAQNDAANAATLQTELNANN